MNGYIYTAIDGRDKPPDKASWKEISGNAIKLTSCLRILPTTHGDDLSEIMETESRSKLPKVGCFERCFWVRCYYFDGRDLSENKDEPKATGLFKYEQDGVHGWKLLYSEEHVPEVIVPPAKPPFPDASSPKPGMKQFDSGAVRSSDADYARYDLIPRAALEVMGRTLKAGAERYGPYNWQNGIPESDLMNHCLQHIHKWLEGDRSEDHIGHAMCNLAFLAHFKLNEIEDIYNTQKHGTDGNN